MTAIDDLPKMTQGRRWPRTGGESSKPQAPVPRKNQGFAPLLPHGADAFGNTWRRNKVRMAGCNVNQRLTIHPHRHPMTAPDILLVDDDPAILELGVTL